MENLEIEETRNKGIVNVNGVYCSDDLSIREMVEFYNEMKGIDFSKNFSPLAVFKMLNEIIASKEYQMEKSSINAPDTFSGVYTTDAICKIFKVLTQYKDKFKEQSINESSIFVFKNCGIGVKKVSKHLLIVCGINILVLEQL